VGKAVREMTPVFFTRQAERFYSYRWLFFAVSASAFVRLALLVTPATLPANRLPVSYRVVAFLAPVIFVPWGLGFMCLWFHPTDGNLYANGGFIRRLPVSIQTMMRWCAAVLLAWLLVVGGIVIPIFGWVSGR